jgi:hypothetical protein
MKPQSSGFRKGFLLGATERRTRRRRIPEKHGEPSAVETTQRGVEEKKGVEPVFDKHLLPSHSASARDSAEQRHFQGESWSAVDSSSPSSCERTSSGRAKECRVATAAPTTRRNPANASPVRLVQVIDDADDTPLDPQKSAISEQISPFESTKSSFGDLGPNSGGGVGEEKSGVGSESATSKPAEASEFVRFHSLWRQALQEAIGAMLGRPPSHSRRRRGGDVVPTRPTSRQILADFLERHVTTDEQWRWCWQLACGDPPPSNQRGPSRNQRATHALLGEMLRRPLGVRSLRDSFKARDADSRAWTLTCLAWLDDVLYHNEHESSQNDPEQEDLAKALVIKVLPFLVEIVETEATRTVLAQRSLEGAIGMVGALCDPLNQTKDGDPDDDAMASFCNAAEYFQDVLFDAIPLLHRLWDVHLSWLKNTNADDLLDKVKNQCRRSVLLAWKARASASRKRCWCRDVCGGVGLDILRQIAPPDSPSCLGFGGLAQSVGPRDKSLSETTVVAILTGVDHDGDPASRRIALRGMLGWLGQRRKNLERLSRTSISSLLPIVHRWVSNADSQCDVSVSVTVMYASCFPPASCQPVHANEPNDSTTADTHSLFAAKCYGCAG